MKNVLLSVIIVNYNTSHLLKSCLENLYKSLKNTNIALSSEVIVVDNASSDQSVGVLRKDFPNVFLISNKQNYGFARANNIGISHAKGDYILLLNTDARVEGDAIRTSLDILKKDSKIGVVGAKLLYEDRSLQMSVGFFPTILRLANWMFFIDDVPFVRNFLSPYHVSEPSFYEKRQEVDWVTGAYFMVQKKVLDVSGLLDESLFMYGEEVEWCYRIKKNKFKVVYDPHIKVIHDKGGSSKSGKNAGIIEEFKFILYFYKKYSGNLQLFFIKGILKSGILLRLIIFGILSGYRDRVHLYEKAFHMA
jgi:GT2 family glycosyltransferase